MLTDAGWTEGKDWVNEVELPGMPNKSEVGYADYVLYDDTHRPLAVIEAKRTCMDPSKGRQQAKLYADLLEQEQLFVSDVKEAWMCLHCGYVVDATVAPANCPVCRHPQGYFIRAELTPFRGGSIR